MEPHLELESGSGLRARSSPFLQDQTQATRLHLVLRGGPRDQAEAATKLQEGIKERKQGSETLNAQGEPALSSWESPASQRPAA